MATIKLAVSSNTSNVARSRSKIGLILTNNSISGNIVETVTTVEPPIVICEQGLIFSCEDNSQYLPLV
jgi:hypothetical protein